MYRENEPAPFVHQRFTFLHVTFLFHGVPVTVIYEKRTHACTYVAKMVRVSILD